MDSRTHYVYHLFVGGDLVYVGRTICPRRRKSVFQKRAGVVVSAMKLFPFNSLKEAQEREIADIVELNPAYNLYVASSPTSLGKKQTEVTRKKISLANRGRVISEQGRKNMSLAYINRHTDESRRKIGEAQRKMTRSAETRVRVAEGMRRVWRQRRDSK